jgi:hypothetical protein
MCPEDGVAIQNTNINKHNLPSQHKGHGIDDHKTLSNSVPNNFQTATVRKLNSTLQQKQILKFMTHKILYLRTTKQENGVSGDFKSW